MVLRYANWFLELGVKRDQCVAFYLQNSAELMFAWMGLLAINAYPAMINFNLEGGGLVHCVRISKAQIILMDDELRNRVLENDHLKSMGLKMLVLNGELKTQIKGRPVVELPESVTQGTNDMSTLALRYTRCVKLKEKDLLTISAAQPAIRKPSEAVSVDHISLLSAVNLRKWVFEPSRTATAGTLPCRYAMPQLDPHRWRALSEVQRSALRKRP
jgi:acyl-CoA synthetase (AMP-forming)/AMP-acid ligase II